MPGGRPSKYKPEYCEQIVEYMAQGASATAFAGSIGVSRDTITEWAKAHPEFFVALQEGKSRCASWWESIARMNAATGKGNSNMTIFALKNLSPDDFADRKEIKHRVEMDEDELNEKLRQHGIDPDEI